MPRVPENHFRISEGLVRFVEFFKGKDRVNIRKTYTDKETGDLCLGKGLCIDLEQWEDLAANWQDFVFHVDQIIHP